MKLLVNKSDYSIHSSAYLSVSRKMIILLVFHVFSLRLVNPFIIPGLNQSPIYSLKPRIWI